MFFGIIIGVVILIYVVSLYNSLIGSTNKTQEAFASIEASFQQRMDALVSQCEAVRSYMDHESEVFSSVTKLRQNIGSLKTSEEKVAFDQELTQAQTLFRLTAENYPDIKANENVLVLQKTVNELEDRLYAARRAYNAAVISLNNSIQMFPNNIFVGFFGGKFKPMETLKADEAAKVRPNISGMLNRKD